MELAYPISVILVLWLLKLFVSGRSWTFSWSHFIMKTIRWRRTGRRPSQWGSTTTSWRSTGVSTVKVRDRSTSNMSVSRDRTCSRSPSPTVVVWVAVDVYIHEWESGVLCPAWHITGHFVDESFQAITCTGTDNTKQTGENTPETQKTGSK